jgi:hypothetical protein
VIAAPAALAAAAHKAPAGSLPLADAGVIAVVDIAPDDHPRCPTEDRELPWG